MKTKIAPSILSADFGRINEEIAQIEPFVDLLHVDVMDGHFVPNITFGAPVVSCFKTGLPMDCHLMIEHPENYIEDFVKAMARTGCTGKKASITVHQEACVHLYRVIQLIKSFKNEAGESVRAAVAINPATPIEMIRDVLDDVDMVLVMSVNPGFGGQKFIPVALEKIAALRKLKPNLDIQVDGGINAQTAKQCIEAGANILVAGSYIFGAEGLEARKQAIESLR